MDSSENIYSSERVNSLMSDIAGLCKKAYQPAPSPQGAAPAGMMPPGMPPGAAGMMPQGMPPGAAGMMPQGMPPGAAGMMPPGGAPQPAAPPSEIEAVVSQMITGMEHLTGALEQERAEKKVIVDKLQEMTGRMGKLESMFQQADSMPAGM